MISSKFLAMRPLFILAGLLLLGGSGLVWVYAADSDGSLVQVSKTVDLEAQRAGETVQFTITIRNDGNDRAAMTLIDRMPDGMILKPGTLNVLSIDGVTTVQVADTESVTWEGQVFSNGAAVITYEAQIAETATIDEVLVNEAVVTSPDGTITASASVTVSRFKDGLPFVFLPMLSWAGVPGLCYQEQNKAVVVDITRQEPNGWEYVYGNGALGDGFYRWPEGHDVIRAEGRGILKYIVRIDNPGRYYMRMHSLNTHPHLGTEANDVWMKMQGEGWEKVVTWSYQWKTWGWAAGREIHTSTSTSSQNPPFWDFDSAGEYTFQLSARSGQYGIERMAFYQSDALGFGEPANHQRDSSVRNQVDNALDAQPVSDLCKGYIPPYFNR